ncbi:AprI/Inh family metalloprotease inhibitor [Rhodovulum sp. PH10]|uniref:AprI/Inh family metalloprotease inhibitor n=1 Tax=Rhodovulum sp. PH10 TaxID=1187851 RepID=UPI00178C7D50|nr:AprI/Inh family metalloprotease inhibitor [Rhodovulum sp. PH10]
MPADAPAGADAVQAMLGAPWEFSNADRDRHCVVSFHKERAGRTGAGMKIELAKDCVGQFPFLSAVAGWTLADNDFLRFVDAGGKPLLEFSEVEQGLFEAPKPEEGILFLQPVATLQPPPPTTAEMAGRWAMTRGDATLCSFDLATSTTPDGLALTVAPGCDAAVAAFAPSAWIMDRGELVLVGSDDRTWRFEEIDPKVWQRVPESRNPVRMMKQ